MLTFNVVKEPYGWAIRMGDRMSTPYRSRLSAIRDAHGLAEAIRRQGGCTEVVVEGEELGETFIVTREPSFVAQPPQAQAGL